VSARHDDPGHDDYDDGDDYDDEDYDDGDDEEPRATERPGQGRLQVVDDRYADLPPPPPTRSESIRDAAATFFDQDLA
jgi:hypothetical protein